MTPGNYFFVHIPKTAGTSFRYALGQNPAVRMLFNYGRKSPDSSPELIAYEHALPGPEIFHADKLNVFCGHVPYRKYRDYVTPERVLSIVRNPVERVLSAYQHHRRHNGLTTDFATFCATPQYQNQQWRMLRGLRPRSGGLVGVTSHYAQFLEAASRCLGVEVKPMAANAAPASDAAERVTITAGEINAAYRQNAWDLRAFFAYARVFAGRLRDAGYRTIPSPDAQWSCRIDEARRIVGWLARGATDCYFVVIAVNGAARAILALDQERRDVQERGLTQHPVCGFAYPLALVGARSGDKVSISVLEAPAFTKVLNA